ncbi:conserved membrane hypothetical protein [Hyella patelloides LEGE 07179]|uniref:Glycosyltransferase RgtA/B/C/D-like domain-containing protein n=1 Tax=Hyella patelloides LEGE 07179 TaxID=945734 RepID=A0A563VPW1_9CYAN|nr:hypothetical protein [Hyella patelloides]VEP13419.1 conserved membrane hypothetical protein [Hyella patelloides LEGE 07179]
MKLFLKSKSNFWLTVSIITAILFSLSGLKIALQSPYTVQDDARQYIFWMQQFNGNGFWQNDLIADYFKSVTPVGFTNLYRLVGSLGIDVFFFNKISTLIIGVTTTIYCFLVCVEIFPIPFAGFISSLLLNQNLWMVDDLSSGTPRAFIYVFLLAFIYYLLRQNLILCLLMILLQGLFYPQAVLISVMVLSLRLLQYQKPQKIELWGLFVSVIILAAYGFKTSNFAPVVTASQAKLLQEFLPEGRSAFFSDSFSGFWLTGRRSGFFTIEWQYSLMCIYGISLWWLQQYPNRFPLVKEIKPQIKVLLELFLASVLLFLLAHLLLFRLHLPARYTHHTQRIIIALIDGITIAVIFNKFISWIDNIFCKKSYVNISTRFICLIALICILLYPTYAVQSYPERLGYVTGESEELYQFLQQQPKDILIATLSKEADFIPSLAARSVLVAKEYAIPYHRGYYQQISQRVQDLISAQYSLEQNTLVDFIKKYNVDLLLIDNNSFTVEYLTNNQWLQQFKIETNRAIDLLKNKQKPILIHYSDRCNVFKTKNQILLDTSCIVKLIK